MASSANEVLAAGVDIGGSKVAVAGVRADGTTVDRVEFATPGSGLVARVARELTALRKAHPTIRAVGVGAAGIYTWPDGERRFAANVLVEERKVQTLLEGRIGLPVIVDNDVNTAAFYESRVLGGEAFLLIAVGTGIGGAWTSGSGAVMHASNGVVGEIGHLTYKEGGLGGCGCGSRGCLEMYASGLALKRVATDLVRSSHRSKMHELAGGNPRNVTTALAITAALGGDDSLRAAIAEMGVAIGKVVVNATVLTRSELVVVGGGLATSLKELLIAPIRKQIEDGWGNERFWGPPPTVQVVSNPDATLIGAALQAVSMNRGLERRADNGATVGL